MRKLFPLVLAVLLLAGCGNSGSGAAGVVSVPDPNSGVLVFNFLLARAVPATVDTIEFHGYTEDGRLVFGPLPRAKASQIVIDQVPLGTRVVTLDYYDSEVLVAHGEVNVVLVRNSQTVVDDPDFVEVTASSLVVLPETAVIPVGSSRQLAATVTLSTGDTFTLAEGASFSSSDPAVATVDGTGTVLGLAPGNAVITISYRGASDTVAIEVVQP